MSSAPIYNPMIPCIEPIPGGMYPGRMVRIQGNTPPGAQRFAFNLQCGPNTDPRDDIALHLNFRFVEMCIVRNNLTNMNWGPEEIGGGMPLVPGQAFEALLLCEPNSFKVALNGVHFCEFAHRTPPQRVTHFTIDGDVNIQFVGFEGSQPQGYMPQQPGYAPQAYGAPPPAYGYAQSPQQGYEQPLYSSGVQGVQPARRGLGTGAAVGLGVGALAAGGLAGYALGGGFSSDDSPREEPQYPGAAQHPAYPPPNQPELPQPPPPPQQTQPQAPAIPDYAKGAATGCLGGCLAWLGGCIGKQLAGGGSGSGSDRDAPHAPPGGTSHVSPHPAQGGPAPAPGSSPVTPYPPAPSQPKATPMEEPKAGQTAEPKAGQTAQPEVGQTAKPEAGQTAKPEAEQTAKPEAEQTTKPQTAEPEVEQTAEPIAQEDITEDEHKDEDIQSHDSWESLFDSESENE